MKENGRNSQLFSENLRNEIQIAQYFCLFSSFDARPWVFVGYNRTYLRRYFAIITRSLVITGQPRGINRLHSIDNPKITFLC